MLDHHGQLSYTERMTKTITISHRDAIEMFGSIKNLADQFFGDYELDYHQIWKWHNRNRIPVEYWEEVVEIANRLDIPLTTKILASASSRKTGATP